MALSCCIANAQTIERVTVDSALVEKFVTAITVSGDSATLAFSDGTTMTADIGEVNIKLSYEGTLGIDKIKAGAEVRKGVYTLDGKFVGDSPKGLRRGAYIVNGKKVIIK